MSLEIKKGLKFKLLPIPKILLTCSVIDYNLDNLEDVNRSNNFPIN